MTDAEYVYKGAKALVFLHDERIRSFYNVRKEQDEKEKKKIIENPSPPA